MKLSEYIVALKRLAKSLPGEDPEMVVCRYSDYTTLLDGDDVRGTFPRIVTLLDVPGSAGEWHRRDRPDLPMDEQKRRRKFIELAAGN
jgi:hypothetical protein